ncbi:hypothetical protein D0Z07_4420 [Hyphodiscus hymeniophilus]|uniref:Uncharacterized protein n=1 Tax=Hyphodiscus hymeniophilus TaxID=353542 RepID=A0A9P6VK04_9HELO|nr:hypothetical protein D0Z07_4420 [Hyphodiscus hymeniophilus]
MVQRREPGYLGQFRPSNSVLRNVGLLEEGRLRVSPDTYGSSNNYQGDITIEHNRSQHQTAAAKIVFFERHQAEAFMTLVSSGRFLVKGRQIRHVRWNKIKSARYPNSISSRAIRLIGPRYLMDFGFFEVFFSQRFTYELEGRREVPCVPPGMVAHEWIFGSLRCQASSAKTAVERELRGIFSVEWARDPCM